MDWKKIISDLVQAGLTQKEIGDKAGLKQASVSDLMNGNQKTVKWETGETLLAMHRLHCVNQSKEAA